MDMAIVCGVVFGVILLGFIIIITFNKIILLNDENNRLQEEIRRLQEMLSKKESSEKRPLETVVFRKNCEKCEKHIAILREADINGESIEVTLLRKKCDEYEREIAALRNSSGSEAQSVREKLLQEDIEKLQRNHKQEVENLLKRLDCLDVLNAHIVEREMADIIISSAWKDIVECANEKYAEFGIPPRYNYSKQIPASMRKRFISAVDDQYRYQFLIYLYPELEIVFDWKNIRKLQGLELEHFDSRMVDLSAIINKLNQNKSVAKENMLLKSRIRLFEKANSNLEVIPYMAQIMADYETYELELLAKKLEWGHNEERLRKIKSIREIRKDAKKIVERYKEAEYQLAYLLNLYPNLQDVVDAEFEQLPLEEIKDISDYDGVRDYLSKEEYQKLSVCERNQLALDRYVESHKKSKWQIGRDYELYVGYKYSQMGFDVDYFGSYMGLEDLGRDLIVKKGTDYLIVQCKYWSLQKEIHENHITQLYGTMVCFCIENHIEKERVEGILITNTKLSEMAKKMAEYLGIRYKENFAMEDYPRIKCNIGHGADGLTKIYHLPFDQQYDVTKIKGPGEFFALTVKEAEDAGFRRAFKWFGSK